MHTLFPCAIETCGAPPFQWVCQTRGLAQTQFPENPQAELLKSVSYRDALDKQLGIMDATAFALAQEHRQRMRVFTIFEDNALITAAQNESFGTTIS